MANKQPITISTKTGDTGTSGLANGERLGKDDPVFSVIGELDELNSWLGVVAASFDKRFAAQQAHVYEIQDTLFYIGAQLARSPKVKLTAAALSKLERRANRLQISMADGWHTKFLLPGGTVLGGYIDVARTVCRRAERAVVAYSKQAAVAPLILKYMNRLSDYLYLLRCFVNLALEYKEQEFLAR